MMNIDKIWRDGKITISPYIYYFANTIIAETNEPKIETTCDNFDTAVIISEFLLLFILF